jgi:outer membrane lipoprotein carrier protein
MRHWILPLAAWALWTAAIARPAAQPAPVERVARALQAHYDTVRDFSAAFVQTYTGGVLGQTATERGRLLVKRPGRMRWEYESPERKLLVADGRKLYFYIPADRQVIIGDVPEDDRATTGALFLTGKGNLLRDFAVAYDRLDGAPADFTVLRLTPRRAEPEYDWLILAVDPATLQIRMLVQLDGQGGRSTFTFTDVKEDVGLADNQFTFSIPRGVDVITDSVDRR